MYIGLIVYLYKLSAFKTSVFPRHGVMDSLCSSNQNGPQGLHDSGASAFQDGQHVVNVRTPPDAYS
jgi:hypothetical protein